MEDLDQMIAKASIALHRDINSIVVEGASKKLSKASAGDLVAYVKLLTELTKLSKGKEKELAKVSEEDLRSLAKELLK